MDKKAAGKKVLFVVAPTGFRDEEYFEPKKILESAGAAAVTASTRAGTLSGKLGGTAAADLALADANPADYVAIAFVGGPGCTVFWKDPAAHRIAREMATAGKLVAAICSSPATLAYAGLLKGKKATSFPTERGILASGGAIFTGNAVETDGNIVTANGPEAAAEFARTLIVKLTEQ